MTQVPSLADTPKLPAMLGTETLAMLVSSADMKLASDSSRPAPHIAAPVSGATAVHLDLTRGGARGHGGRHDGRHALA